MCSKNLKIMAKRMEIACINPQKGGKTPYNK